MALNFHHQAFHGIYYALLTRGIHVIRIFSQDKALEQHSKDVVVIH